MSDLCGYEFEDTVWNEFYLTDDHTVPHPAFEQVDNHSIRGANHKKACREETEDRRAPRYVDQGSLSRRRNQSLEKDSSSHRRTVVLPSSKTESIKASSHGSEFGADDTILSGMVTPVDDANSFDLLDNTDEKDANDLLYYNWPDIGNFEDVDMMFRSDDSTFGLGNNKDNDLGWFTSVNDAEGCSDLMKSDFQFSGNESEAMEIMSENSDSSKWYSVSDPAITNGQNWYRDPSWSSETSDPYVSFANGTSMVDHRDGFVPQEQDINMHKKQYKLEKQSMEKSRKFKPFTVGNQCQFSGNESNASEGLGQVVPGSLNSQETSTKSSKMDDISLEASSFHQLRLVMEQLDSRTKQCMKDSLYRLARSAEQRNHHTNLNGGFGEESDSNGDNCVDYLDMETDTNPIDRSIAHLLFHRACDEDTMQVHSPNTMNF